MEDTKNSSRVGVRWKRPEAGAGRIVEGCALGLAESRPGAASAAAATWRDVLAGGLGRWCSRLGSDEAFPRIDSTSASASLLRTSALLSVRVV